MRFIRICILFLYYFYYNKWGRGTPVGGFSRHVTCLCKVIFQIYFWAMWVVNSTVPIPRVSFLFFFSPDGIVTLPVENV